jgi:hypothetical protein
VQVPSVCWWFFGVCSCFFGEDCRFGVGAFGAVPLPICGRPTLMLSPCCLFGDVLPFRCRSLGHLDPYLSRCLFGVDGCCCDAGGCSFGEDLPLLYGFRLLPLLDLFFIWILQIFPCLLLDSVLRCMASSAVERLGLDRLFLFLRCVDLLSPGLWGAGLTSAYNVTLDLLRKCIH